MYRRRKPLYYKTIEGFQTRRDNYRDKLDELRHASADAWEGFKVLVKGTWQELKKGVVGAMCLLFAAGGLACLSAGCAKKEKIVDIKAPGVDIEVNKTKDGIEIEAGKKKDRVLDIEAPGVDVEVRKSGDRPKD